jgi:hypothetical protein
MLYTIVPLERVYSNRTQSILGNSSYRNTVTADAIEESEYKSVSIQYGNLYAKRVGDHYVVDGIRSTDMNDYLNNNYMPGTILKQ